MALCKCSIDTIRNKIIVTNYLLIQNIPATWMLITDNNFHYFNTIVIKYAVTLTSEVDLELQLIVINFLSLVTLTSTMYLKNKYLEWKECSIIKALLLCLILHAQKNNKSRILKESLEEFVHKLNYSSPICFYFVQQTLPPAGHFHLL